MCVWWGWGAEHFEFCFVVLLLKVPVFIWQSYREHKREQRDLPPPGSLPIGPQGPGINQAKAKSHVGGSSWAISRGTGVVRPGPQLPNAMLELQVVAYPTALNPCAGLK